MTEAIKQWIVAEAEKEATLPAHLGGGEKNPHIEIGVIRGLVKGIEIAEGFDNWKRENEIPLRWVSGGKFYLYNGRHLTTSQLLEKYLLHLETLNKEK